MPKDFSIDFLLGRVGSSREGEPTSSGGKEKIRMKLEGQTLWRQFHSLGTEMIVTKSGRSVLYLIENNLIFSRRMFPTLSVSISGLEPAASYSLMVDLECVDNKRYRYSFHQSKWTATGPGNPLEDLEMRERESRRS